MTQKQGIVYKMISIDEKGEFYVGSTMTSLYFRYHLHKSVSKIKPHIKAYEYFSKIGWINVKLVTLETCQNITRQELREKERRWMEELCPSLNNRIPSRTKKEWYDDKRDQILKSSKAYYQQNRESIIERQKKWYVMNKEKVQKNNKIWYQNNKEQILEKYRQRRNKMKENMDG